MFLLFVPGGVTPEKKALMEKSGDEIMENQIHKAETIINIH